MRQENQLVHLISPEINQTNGSQRRRTHAPDPPKNPLVTTGRGRFRTA